MKNIDYERAFKKVAEQVRFELNCAENPSEHLVNTEKKRASMNGTIFAYKSILGIIEELESGQFFYLEGEDVPEESEEEDWG